MKHSFPVIVGSAFAFLALTSTCAPAAADENGPRTAFRVCQDPNNLPFSNTKGEGFENKIAEVFAKDLKLPVTYYGFPERMGFIRNTLKMKVPGRDYPCDIVMGVPADYDMVSVTQPYYRSTYALVYAPGKGMDGVKSVDEFLKLPADTLQKLRIGVYDRSPASEWLAKHKLVNQGVPYRILNADPAQYPGQIIEDDLAHGKIDAAIVWGPIAGYFAKRVKSPQLTVVPMPSEPGVKFDYAIAMGVRYGERDWKKQIESLIDKHRADIEAILRDYNVPLLELKPAAARQ